MKMGAMNGGGIDAINRHSNNSLSLSHTVLSSLIPLGQNNSLHHRNRQLATISEKLWTGFPTDNIWS